VGEDTEDLPELQVAAAVQKKKAPYTSTKKQQGIDNNWELPQNKFAYLQRYE
jgi:hypothetical protein